MEKEVAFEIDSCVSCEGLYFPGDDIVVTSDGAVHDYCFQTQNSERKLVLKS